MIALTLMETRLMIREKAALLIVILLPAALLVGFGLSSDGTVDPKLGQTMAGFIAAIGLGIALAVIGFTIVPATLATYRERGMLRRLAVTPARPHWLLVAQLVVNTALALVATAVLLILGRVGFGVPLPVSPGWFALAFVLTLAALFAIGLLIAAVARTGKTGQGIGMAVFFPSMFFAGVYVPVEFLPRPLQVAGDFTPLGAGLHALRDSWTGETPTLLHLLVLSAWAVVAGTLAARFFRWE
ncbi:ABC transporter permease [Bailinhaonella thermotolerans]|uniref:Transport permease protein n=1 Tax=Bailinhaonella thermotolerans TaxID=1070861 RepID=A0A3A4BHH2_9ACTN|nr:ABC transporter permease [Bailinhaonella thermotolerans]RJL34242.1 ABC transporter permease [Bailinhaonella thermotolerans]